MTSLALALLIAMLGDGHYARREAASKALDHLGAWGYAVAARHLNDRDAEVAHRCRAFAGSFKPCLTCLDEPPSNRPCESCAGTGVWRNN